jgi:hypothetical protein
MAYLVTKENTKYKTFTDEYAFHGLKKDSTGLLTYTKVLLSSDESVSLTEGTGFAYGGLQDLQDNLNNAGENINLSRKDLDESEISGHQNNSGKRSYDQTRLDKDKLVYFMNVDGYLVARYLKDFTFSERNGATRNWKA